MIPLIPPALSPFSIAFYRNKFPELSILIVSVFSLPILYKTNFLVSLIPIASKPLLSMSSQSPPLINLMVNSQPLSYFRALDMVDHFLLFEIFSSLSFQYTTFSCLFFFFFFCMPLATPQGPFLGPWQSQSLDIGLTCVSSYLYSLLIWLPLASRLQIQSPCLWLSALYTAISVIFFLVSRFVYCNTYLISVHGG